MNYYKFYKIVRNEILNTYVFKSLENFSIFFFINDNKMKIINTNKKIIKN